jgi:putative transposase
VVTSEDKEQCLAYTKEKYKVKHARACKLFNCSRGKQYYKRLMPIKDEPIKQAINEVIQNKKRGRNKVIHMIQKRYPDLSKSKIRRVYERNGFTLTKKLRRRIKDNPKNPIEVTMQANIEWAIDFMSDSLVNGRVVRTLNVIDHYNRECKGIIIKHSFPAVRVIEFMEEIISVHGKPNKIRTDNGPEFTSKQFQLWMKKNNIEWSKIQKGSPQQNAIIERFNKTVREDLLDPNLLFSLDHANELAQEFIREYNYERPHESLNNKTPIEYAA